MELPDAVTKYLEESLKRKGCTVLAREWDVRGGPHLGKGDLVVLLPCNTHLVVEVKYLDFDATGRNQCVKRRKHRRYVEEQAPRYGAKWAEHYALHNQLVLSAFFTNETGLSGFALDVQRPLQKQETDEAESNMGVGWIGAGVVGLAAIAGAIAVSAARQQRQCEDNGNRNAEQQRERDEKECIVS
ncbi:hypothetical protein JKP88DRAFT_353175 [Tribonema minus]|uniref:NERD domain-containing protein n=1 Tax=Tribonema minus TaxID=303371 RepID=A0A836CMZ6_9STRA|nr:hypothetical protein JKP88DRAFT_353175 [Tribonema minus]